MCSNKIRIFFLWLSDVLMVSEKYLKAVFSTEPLSHAETTNSFA